MESNNVKLYKSFEAGKMSRRQLMQALSVSAGAAFAASAVPKAMAAFAGSAAQNAMGAGRSFPVVTVNHLSLAASDYAKSRDWYVDLFGMRVVWDDGKKCELDFGSLTEPNGMYITGISTPNAKPGVGHFAFGVPNFMENKAAMKAEMERRGLTNIRPDGEVGWSALDPAGYMLNTWVPIKDKAMYPGAAGPCAEAQSASCKEEYEVGLKNLSSVPKASGKGFKATSYSHIVLNVPEADLEKEKEFYTGMYGMKLIYEKKDPQSPEIFLRFGRNTLYLRKTAKPDDKPYCNHYAFVVQDYNQAKAEAELKRRGLDPKPDSKLGWTIADPDGMRIEVAGWGLPEHIANDCKGGAQTCPGGDRG
jgi:catechol 2,3-dioxygenase-like lactoylglutathione lyase family enzyme